MVAEKTAKNFRGLLYFAAPCTSSAQNHGIVVYFLHHSCI